MPAISVYVDGKLVAEVPTTGMDVLSVRVGGTTRDDNLAKLDVSGGAYPKSGPSTYLTWINSMPLLPRQLVSAAFKSDGALSHPGKTIDELYPDELDTGPYVPISIEERVTELRAMLLTRENFSLRAQATNGKMASIITQPEEHGFNFLLLWDSHHPTRATCMLSTYTLDSLITKAPSTIHLRERLTEGESVELEVS